MIRQPCRAWSDALPHPLSDLIRRWPRQVLHAGACGVVVVGVGWGVVSAGPGRGDPGPAPAGEPIAAAPPAPAPGSITDVEPPNGAPDAPGLDAAGSAPQAADGLPVQMQTYMVQPGDSVRTIARQFGVSNETLIWVNDLSDPDILLPGQELKILPFSGLIHEVRPGDTVAAIANGYEARVEDVIRVNRLRDPYIITVGQKLVVPGGYRPLPQKIVPAAPAGPDSVQAPGDREEQAAAAAPTRRPIPSLGNTPQERFIAAIAEPAMASQEETGVPASVTIAQAILESYWGSSRLAREANNYFGIKAQPKPGPAGVLSLDVWEVSGGQNVVQRAAFRAYNSVAESIADHGRFFLENGRYAAALAVRRDARQFAREISRAGYATDPAYATKLIDLMDRYNLYRFDS